MWRIFIKLRDSSFPRLNQNTLYSLRYFKMHLTLSPLAINRTKSSNPLNYTQNHQWEPSTHCMDYMPHFYEHFVRRSHLDRRENNWFLSVWEECKIRFNSYCAIGIEQMEYQRIHGEPRRGILFNLQILRPRYTINSLLNMVFIINIYFLLFRPFFLCFKCAWFTYRSSTLNSSTVNWKFHLIQIFGEIVYATLSSSCLRCPSYWAILTYRRICIQMCDRCDGWL